MQDQNTLKKPNELKDEYQQSLQPNDQSALQYERQNSKVFGNKNKIATKQQQNQSTQQTQIPSQNNCENSQDQQQEDAKSEIAQSQINNVPLQNTECGDKNIQESDIIHLHQNFQQNDEKIIDSSKSGQLEELSSCSLCRKISEKQQQQDHQISSQSEIIKSDEQKNNFLGDKVKLLHDKVVKNIIQNNSKIESQKSSRNQFSKSQLSDPSKTLIMKILSFEFNISSLYKDQLQSNQPQDYQCMNSLLKDRIKQYSKNYNYFMNQTQVILNDSILDQFNFTEKIVSLLADISEDEQSVYDYGAILSDEIVSFQTFLKNIPQIQNNQIHQIGPNNFNCSDNLNSEKQELQVKQKTQQTDKHQLVFDQTSSTNVLNGQQNDQNNNHETVNEVVIDQQIQIEQGNSIDRFNQNITLHNGGSRSEQLQNRLLENHRLMNQINQMLLPQDQSTQASQESHDYPQSQSQIWQQTRQLQQASTYINTSKDLDFDDNKQH